MIRKKPALALDPRVEAGCPKALCANKVLDVEITLYGSRQHRGVSCQKGARCNAIAWRNKIRTRANRPVASTLLAVTVSFALTLAPTSRSIAQTKDIAQTAIRAALAKWTNEFNARNVEGACSLFSTDLRYDFRGFPERNYTDMCDGLRRALTDSTKRYAYSLAVKEVLVSGDLAIVRLTWTLTVTKPDARPEVSREPGIDVFKRQADGTWKIIRFLAYDEPG
jgi:ketosteroid isomerase-like protein